MRPLPVAQATNREFVFATSSLVLYFSFSFCFFFQAPVAEARDILVVFVVGVFSYVYTLYEMRIDVPRVAVA